MNTQVEPCKAPRKFDNACKSLVAIAGGGKLVRLRVYNRGASTVYLMIFNVAALPNDGATPSLPPVPIVAGGYYETDTGDDFDTGCVIAGSSTNTTLTLIGAADLSIAAGVK